ncbi:hypothetical protein ACFW1J_03950 [Priestia aryabhattai]|uniref:hypothetical protein n=1 Tax=Priestia TaxID=2800373 RepID=UPI0008DD2256|nr:hypothetical protein [Priestia aryabhattai]MBX9966887.1 hypothetical protein [Priestia aryabhattai]MBZ6487611.1 hypothetical protein [Priestia aryabhattai]MDH3114468.1 hypothetical protein [Priestia aryabhattai]MDH3126634.1 hypothetical protein [Priestia aryabhattai]MDH3133121.1 hypothetical protein [Priestia aryabhattai]
MTKRMTALLSVVFIAALFFMSQTSLASKWTTSASIKPHHYSKHEEKMLAVTNLDYKSNIIAYDVKAPKGAKEAYVKATYYEKGKAKQPLFSGGLTVSKEFNMFAITYKIDDDTHKVMFNVGSNDTNLGIKAKKPKKMNGYSFTGLEKKQKVKMNKPYPVAALFGDDGSGIRVAPLSTDDGEVVKELISSNPYVYLFTVEFK